MRLKIRKTCACDRARAWVRANAKPTTIAMLCLWWLASGLTFAGILGCASVPEAAHTAERLGTPQATAFCFGKWQAAQSAAGACAETCASEDLSQYCARKKCAGELDRLKAWAEVESWCWARYTPEIYHPRPKWPNATWVPIAEEDM